MKLFILVLISTLFSAPSVFACCASPEAPIKERMDKAALIFVGEVVSIMKVDGDKYRRIASVKVNKSIKGAEGLKWVDVHFNIASDITTRPVSSFAKLSSAWSCGLIDKDVIELKVSQNKPQEWLFYIEEKDGSLFTSSYWGTDLIGGNGHWEFKDLRQEFPGKI
jgi:hypothetical protein